MKEWQKWSDDLTYSIGRDGDLPHTEIYYESGQIRLKGERLYTIKEYHEDGQAKARASDFPECIEPHMSVADWWLNYRGGCPYCKEHEWSK